MPKCTATCLSARASSRRSRRSSTPCSAPRSGHLSSKSWQTSAAGSESRVAPPKNAAAAEAWQKEVARLQGERGDAQQVLARQSGEFRRLEQSLQADAVQVKKLQSLLPPNAALVDILEYEHLDSAPNDDEDDERRLVAFVVRRDSVKRVNLGAVEPIAKAATDWRSAIMNGFGGPDDVPEPLPARSRKRPHNRFCVSGSSTRCGRHFKGLRCCWFRPMAHSTKFRLPPPRCEKGKYLLESFRSPSCRCPASCPAC